MLRCSRDSTASIGGPSSTRMVRRPRSPGGCARSRRRLSRWPCSAIATARRRRRSEPRSTWRKDGAARRVPPRARLARARSRRRRGARPPRCPREAQGGGDPRGGGDRRELARRVTGSHARARVGCCEGAQRLGGAFCSRRSAGPGRRGDRGAQREDWPGGRVPRSERRARSPSRARALRGRARGDRARARDAARGAAAGERLQRRAASRPRASRGSRGHAFEERRGAARRVSQARNHGSASPLRRRDCRARAPRRRAPRRAALATRPSRAGRPRRGVARVLAHAPNARASALAVLERAERVGARVLALVAGSEAS